MIYFGKFFSREGKESFGEGRKGNRITTISSNPWKKARRDVARAKSSFVKRRINRGVFFFFFHRVTARLFKNVNA